MWFFSLSISRLTLYMYMNMYVSVWRRHIAFRLSHLLNCRLSANFYEFTAFELNGWLGAPFFVFLLMPTIFVSNFVCMCRFQTDHIKVRELEYLLPYIRQQIDVWYTSTCHVCVRFVWNLRWRNCCRARCIITATHLFTFSAAGHFYHLLLYPIIIVFVILFCTKARLHFDMTDIFGVIIRLLYMTQFNQNCTALSHQCGKCGQISYTNTPTIALFNMWCVCMCMPMPLYFWLLSWYHLFSRACWNKICIRYSAIDGIYIIATNDSEYYFEATAWIPLLTPKCILSIAQCLYFT